MIYDRVGYKTPEFFADVGVVPLKLEWVSGLSRTLHIVIIPIEVYIEISTAYRTLVAFLQLPRAISQISCQFHRNRQHSRIPEGVIYIPAKFCEIPASGTRCFNQHLRRYLSLVSCPAPFASLVIKKPYILPGYFLKHCFSRIEERIWGSRGATGVSKC